MRIAWPELIVLIVVATLVVLGGEIGALFVVVKVWRAPGGVILPLLLGALIFDIWAFLRMIDWAFAGPARRARHRVL